MPAAMDSVAQQHEKDWRPVAYCSRRLSEAEIRYSQIEKECLAAVWSCERFEKYLYGLSEFKLISDHKLLVPLKNCKDLEGVRCQRLLMRSMRFNPAPRKTLIVADALSRSPSDDVQDCIGTHSDVELYVASIIDSMPASKQKTKPSSSLALSKMKTCKVLITYSL